MAAYPSLLTLFTPPVDCATQWTYAWNIDDTSNGISTTTIGQDWPLGTMPATTCYPPGFSMLPVGRHDPTYSPASHCPVGYRTVSSTAIEAGVDTETVIKCCKSGLSYIPNTWTGGHDCAKSYSTSTAVLVVPFTVGSWTITTGYPIHSSIVGPGEARAMLIELRHKQVDQAIFTTTFSSPTFTARSGATTSTSTHLQTGHSEITGPSTSQSVSSLSPGTKAGIGIGIAIPSLLFLGAMLFILNRRRNSRQNTTQNLVDNNVKADGVDKSVIMQDADKIMVTNELELDRARRAEDIEARSALQPNYVPRGLQYKTYHPPESNMHSSHELPGESTHAELGTTHIHT